MSVNKVNTMKDFIARKIEWIVGLAITFGTGVFTFFKWLHSIYKTVQDNKKRSRQNEEIIAEREDIRPKIQVMSNDLKWIKKNLKNIKDEK